jgi:molecular chaperone DnaK (HSP70)
MATDRIVGIDLGTTNSLVAFMQGETPVAITDEDEDKEGMEEERIRYWRFLKALDRGTPGDWWEEAAALRQEIESNQAATFAEQRMWIERGETLNTWERSEMTKTWKRCKKNQELLRDVRQLLENW